MGFSDFYDFFRNFLSQNLKLFCTKNFTQKPSLISHTNFYHQAFFPKRIFTTESNKRPQCNRLRPQIQLKSVLLWSGSGLNEMFFSSLNVKKTYTASLPSFVVATSLDTHTQIPTTNCCSLNYCACVSKQHLTARSFCTISAMWIGWKEFHFFCILRSFFFLFNPTKLMIFPIKHSVTSSLKNH